MTGLSAPDGSKGCWNPRLVGGDLKALVRCGDCPYCRNRRRWAWVGRLSLELSDHGGVGRFLTLTYAKDPGELDRRDFQLFMKRWRYYEGDCRYFGVGEYGSRSGRGHWHAIIFGSNQAYEGPFTDNKSWPHGFSYDGSATPASINYVASYVLKDGGRSRYRRQSLMSLRPGVGLAPLEQLGENVARATDLQAWPGYYSIGPKRYPLLDGGLMAFQRGYLQAGGKPPLALSPDDRHAVAIADYWEGSRLVGKSQRVRWNDLKGQAGLGQIKRGSL